jgi:uncharacterized protein (DUF952 family)
MIYHMLPTAVWLEHAQDDTYAADTLTSEGFIHCTGAPDLLAEVANRFYRNEPGDFVVLAIDEARVSAPIRWELADGHRFPHIYGPLNLAAVLDILPFPRDTMGVFQPISAELISKRRDDLPV